MSCMPARLKAEALPSWPRRGTPGAILRSQVASVALPVIPLHCCSYSGGRPDAGLPASLKALLGVQFPA